jgi:hypothetical protein
VFVQNAYAKWSADRGLQPGINDGFADDPDGDGRPNLFEFALDGQPLHGGNEGNRRVQIEPVNGTNYLTYTFPVRQAAVFSADTTLSAAADGIAYSLAGSVDWLHFDQPIVEQRPPSQSALPTPSPGWDYRTFRLNRVVSDHSPGFIRLEVKPASL